MSTETKEVPTSDKKENGYQPDTLTGRKVEALKQKIQKFIDFANITLIDATGKTKTTLKLEGIEKDVIEAVSKHFEVRLWAPDGSIEYFWCRINGDNYEVSLNSLEYEAKTTYIVKTVEQVTVTS